MGKPLSMDLRSRALAAVDEGMSCRAAARRFGVAAATVIRWHDQRRSTGGYAAKPQGGDTRSRRIEAYAHTILSLHEARRDITLDELRSELGRAGVTVAISTLHRFFARHGVTRKKRPAMRSSRTAPTS
ncbi:transposase [Sphingomonas sp. SORGH_AS789]|nr:transposase [Sphingomonas sp. SORGH_AS_0789]MDR6148149.1 transposase [Sphingomonas sp. SORGH_AS_0742]MDR6114492.1 transposase [Sphingomonas sp. SORGH_AS_0789]MDR6116025.1 transposase [Sphingomonas sp. SORGH_AS_0789]MDR6149325.1 transposase [Sphingomonas sp. SORGH_AS_0742]